MAELYFSSLEETLNLILFYKSVKRPYNIRKGV